MVHLGGAIGLAADDQRSTCLVDEDGVDLVDDGVVERPLRHIIQRRLHIVAQIVEAELVVGAVGDVRPVGLLALGRAHVADDGPDVQPQEVVDVTHPLGVTGGEIVVDRDQVRAVSGQCVQVQRQRRDQRLTFTGLHLGDISLMKRQTADDLHIVVAHPQRSLARLSHDREGLVEDIFEVCAVVEFLSKLRGLRLELGVGERLDATLEAVDLVDVGSSVFDVALVSGAEYLFQEVEHTGPCLGQRSSRASRAARRL